ncbi:peptide-methionine (R)-S-oxide reductase MsrB [Gallaecimonas mangrovi]|uniref:peptide-methionine (R)-S-oxide reductase MsrB n=1 Tax=Gallaecimonas mangrovi TaxID=2291597 RepID=UPI000E200C8A|nr:peptide-methionine (R)-S-oxide reductase MsrB [Gallaecimonas mangrovi]
MNKKGWKGPLSSAAEAVTQQGATERPFSGEYLYEDRPGIYHCVVCGQALFHSETKFDAGCGWPSFFEEVEQGAVRYLEDNSHGMVRTEIRCGKCDAHLGHVFNDGPAPTGRRYCLNSVALDFEPQA